jgi:hypothetical protein
VDLLHLRGEHIQQETKGHESLVPHTRVRIKQTHWHLLHSSVEVFLKGLFARLSDHTEIHVTCLSVDPGVLGCHELLNCGTGAAYRSFVSQVLRDALQGLCGDTGQIIFAKDLFLRLFSPRRQIINIVHLRHHHGDCGEEFFRQVFRVVTEKFGVCFSQSWDDLKSALTGRLLELVVPHDLRAGINNFVDAGSPNLCVGLCEFNEGL